MSRPYCSLPFDQLEEECGRALRAHDRAALGQLQDELAHRQAGPRTHRLLQMLAGARAAPRHPLPARPQADVGPASSGNRSSVPQVPARGGGNRLPFKPTREQEQAIEAFSTAQSLKINAYAGTGKTSTLQLLAHSTRRTGQYLAFNRKIVEDSRGKFPPEVRSATTHSLAFRALSGRYSTGKLNGRIGANHLVELLGLRGLRIDGKHALAPRSQAYLIQSTLRRFCQSDAPELLLEHVPIHGSLAAAPEESAVAAATAALDGARRVWARMVAAGDAVPLGHDGYLKVWALSGARLPVDYILLDEAQDTSPVVLGLLAKQDAQLVYVGDKFQQIYEWRGAVNAMEKAHAVGQTDLTVSFRFGGEIAWAANRVLEMLGASKTLAGNPSLRSRIGRAPRGTVLARTNAATITAVIEALDARKKPYLVGGSSELLAMLDGVADLKAGQPSPVPEFFGFESWKQLVEFVRNGEGEELTTFVNLVESRGEKQLLWALNRVVDENRCDFVVSTAHKAKGREWDSVRLMDDFVRCLPSKEHRGQPSPPLEPSELRLLYVALTRARRTLDVPPSLMELLKTGQLPPPPALRAAVPPAAPAAPASRRS